MCTIYTNTYPYAHVYKCVCVKTHVKYAYRIICDTLKIIYNMSLCVVYHRSRVSLQVTNRQYMAQGGHKPFHVRYLIDSKSTYSLRGPCAVFARVLARVPAWSLLCQIAMGVPYSECIRNSWNLAQFLSKSDAS
jgi:hypothetical protein